MQSIKKSIENNFPLEIIKFLLAENLFFAGVSVTKYHSKNVKNNFVAKARKMVGYIIVIIMFTTKDQVANSL